MRTMVYRCSVANRLGYVIRIPVSLPLTPQLLDEPGGKYVLPEDVKAPTDRTEAYRRRARRGPTQIKLALAGCGGRP
jgi:hypothetical protein